MIRYKSIQEIRNKVSELADLTLNEIAEKVIDFEDQIEQLTSDVETLQENVAVLEAAQ